MLSIFIASSYVGGCSSIQYLGGESILSSIPSSKTNSFVRALYIMYMIGTKIGVNIINIKATANKDSSRGAVPIVGFL